MDLSVVSEPLWRIPVVRVDVCQRDGEVNKAVGRLVQLPNLYRNVHSQEIEVLKPPVSELLLRKGVNVFAGVERVPKLLRSNLRSQHRATSRGATYFGGNDL